MELRVLHGGLLVFGCRVAIEEFVPDGAGWLVVSGVARSMACTRPN